MKVPIPRSIEVAGHVYEVEVRDGLIDWQTRSTVGRVLHEEQKILLDVRRKPSDLAVTFLHEVIHAIDRRYFADALFDEAHSEQKTDTLAEGLHQVLLRMGVEFTEGE